MKPDSESTGGQGLAEAADKPDPPDAKAESARSLMPLIIIFAVAIAGWSVPLIPTFLTAFVPLTPLQDATYFRGRLEKESPDSDPWRGPLVVVTADGPRPLNCGYLGGRHNCPVVRYLLVGQEIEVWDTWLFGAVQYRFPNFPPNPKVPNPGLEYSTSIELHRNPEYTKQRESLWVKLGFFVLVTCVLGAFEFSRRRKGKSELK